MLGLDGAKRQKMPGETQPDILKCSMRIGENNMHDIDWFCNLMNLDLYPYQKIMLKIMCGKEIKKLRRFAREYESRHGRMDSKRE